MNRLLNDLRYGVRMLMKTPTAAVTVPLVLSLGIGLSALTFSLIKGAVLASLPFEGGDRVVRIGRAEGMSGADYATLSARQRSFEHIGAVTTATATLAIEGAGAEPVSSAAITPSVLALASTQPTMGRGFTEADAVRDAPAVVVVSHDVWRNRLASDPNVLSRTVRINGRPAQVVGVMAEGFRFPWDQQVWTPLHIDPVGLERGDWAVVARLLPSVSKEAATGELMAISSELDRKTPAEKGADSSLGMTSFTDLLPPGQASVLAALMLGIALMVLLVACANVANVLLARAVDRRREVALRLALGASRLRIIAQLLTEISLLAAAGAAGGVGIALIGARLVEGAMPATGMPYWIALRIDLPVLGFVAIVALLTVLMAGLIPAVQASRANPHDLLKDNSRGSSSFRLGRVMRRLIAVEVAISFVLLVLAGLFIKSALNFRHTDLVFEPEAVYTAYMQLPEAKYGDADALARFSDALLETLGGLPQVTGVALASAVPGVGSPPVIPVEPEGAPLSDPDQGFGTRSVVVTPGFFALFRTSPLAGRNFDARDRKGALPVAIVNQAFARQHFPSGALERRIRLHGQEGAQEWRTIIGVTPDLMAGGVKGKVQEAVYLPLAQQPPSELMVLARTRAGFESLTASVRASMAALDSDVALYQVRPLDLVIAQANSEYTWFSILFLISGGIALFLAAIGLYGVMAFWVVQRTREIGVRMALGGQKGDIRRLVVRQGMAQMSIGLVVGVLLALPAARLVRVALFGVVPYDPTVFGSILAVLIGAAWLGCWLPARRATRLSPLHALIAE